MKILYAVQGTGNGHITKARCLGLALANQGAQIDYLFSGRNKREYFDMEMFGAYQAKTGLTFEYHAGKVSLLSTLIKGKVFRFLKDVVSLKLEKYDLVLTDFEPISAWAAKLKNKPCIAIGHQYAFAYDIPKAGETFIGNWILKNFAPAAVSVGLHWHHFNQNILPPIVSNNPHSLVSKQSTLVYLPFECPKQVIALLGEIPEFEFVFFCHNDQQPTKPNVKLKKYGFEEFQWALNNASGVISNAGFELPTQALMLGKKILVKPLVGQMEQQSNALALKQLKLGEQMNHLDKSVIKTWLAEGKGQKLELPDVAEALAQWIVSGRNATLDELSQQLWNKVRCSAYK